MLSPEYYEGCADDILALYEQLEDDIISDVVRRIMKTGKVTETAKHQLEQLQEAGLLYDDILSEIAKRTDATENHVKAIFEDAGVKTVNFDNKIYRENGLTPVDIRQSLAMRHTLEAGYRKTLGNVKNLTMTTANTSQTAYINACNSAYMQVVSGAFSYQEAIKNAVKKTAENGVKVIYPSGYTKRIDVAVRDSVLTGVGQTCREIGLMNAEECGCDLMEISAHSGARPNHAQWQGKIVSLSGRKGYLSKSDIGYGTGDGFGGWNCRHDWYPFFEGYSKPNYSKKALEKLDEKNIEYNGKFYNQYEISQIQRKFEREIRSAKREEVAFKVAVEEADDPDLEQVMSDSLNYVKSLVKKRQAKMRDFIRQTGQNRDYFREQNYPKENLKKDLTFSRNNGNIMSKQLYFPLNRNNFENYFQSVIKIKNQKGSISNEKIHLLLEYANNKIKKLPKNQKAESIKLWNLLICNMQEPIKLIDYNEKFVTKISGFILNSHKEDMYSYRNVRKIYVQAIQEVPVLNKYTIGIPFCSEMPYIDKNGNETFNIGLNINDEIFKRPDIDVIILHELGHYIDFKFIDYDKKSFSKSLIDDFENFKISNIHLNEEEWNRELTILFNDAGQLADIISGITKGKIKGKYSHNKGYWEDEEKLPAETFAHFFEATIRNDKLKIQTYKKVFPNAYQVFLDYFNVGD